MAGITGFGGYVPRLRLQRSAAAKANAWINPGLMGKAKGERAMANWDEDAITMAVEAARDCLGPGDDRAHVKALYFGTTTAPFSDRLNAGILQAALTLEPEAACFDVTSVQRAGLSALAAGLAHADARRETVLVASGERRKTRAASSQELDYGDGAAAILVGPDEGIAAYLGGATSTIDFIDHFRGAHEEYDYGWEERWIRDEGFAKIVPPVITRALANAGVAADKVSAFILPSTLKGVQDAVARKVGLKPEAIVEPLAANVGETGAAHALLMLAARLEKAGPDEIIVVAQFGQGCEAHVFRTTGAIGGFKPQCGVSGWLAKGKPESNYMKWLVFNDLVEWEKGMRAEKDNKTALTTLYRNNDAILGLVGGRCRETGVVQFPRSRISVNPNNPTVDTQEPYKFADRKATILSWSADSLTFALSPPNHFGMMVFEGGGRIFMDITDVDPGEVETGMAMRMAFRVKETDDRRGFTRYFWKAVPER